MRAEIPDTPRPATPEELRASEATATSWPTRAEQAQTLTSGILAGEERYNVLAIHVSDCIRMEGLAELHGIDGDALVAKLQRLAPAQVLALIDAVERYWARDGKGEVL